MLAPGGAAAASSAEGSLTPELEQLSTPALAEASPEAQAEAIGMPVEGPGSLSREGERVVVEAHFEGGALARLEALEAAGAKVMVASQRYQTVALSVEPADLEAIAEVPGIDVVAPARRPMIYAVEGASTAAGGSGSICEGGSVISQGVGQLKVQSARDAFEVDGAGVTVGVLSNSFDSATKAIGGGPIATHAAEDEATNDLPGPAGSCEGQQVPVNVIAEAPEPGQGEELTDEGRAMLQVVHDIAPDADLAFATAFGSELEFARNIERLAEPVEDGGAGAEVIVDDVAYFGEPFFQEGPVANAIQRVTEAGVTYLTAAGNNNLIESSTGREIASWERSSFVDTACPSSLSPRVKEAMANCMNFSPTGSDATFGISVERRSKLTVDLQWAEPWYGVEADLNAYLLNSAGQVLAVETETIKNAGSGAFREPTELLVWNNTSSSKAEVQLVIDRCIHNCNSGANVNAKPRLKLALMENGAGVTKTEYPESDLSAGVVVGPTIFGHAGSPSAITLGAVRYSESSSEPREPERYSSRGPVVHYFEPVRGTTPAARLGTREVVEKPNLTATDCGVTTFFAESTHTFCGTSAAAPHAAGVAALIKDNDPLVSPRRIREAMEASATPFTKVSSCLAVGSGLLEAIGALSASPLAQSSAAEESASPIADECEAELPPEEETQESGTGGTEGETEKEIPVTPPTPTPTPTAPAPTVSVTKGPASVGNESRPTFEFSASQPASFTCQIDGAAPQPCSSPYVAPTALSDGQHGFAVVGTDAEGRSGASNTYYFTVDTKAPRARIVGHPAKLVKTAKATYVARFRLTADQSPVTYYCQVDREPLRICGTDMTARVKPGSHVLKVRARDALGNTSASPSTYRFRVKQIRPAHSRR